MSSVCSQERFYCTWPCGLLATPGFPAGYATNLRCVWFIKLVYHSYVRIRFTAFDILATPEGTCDGDYVIVNDLDRTASRLIPRGKFCNAKRPPAALYGDWEHLHMYFQTDGTGSGAGFSATYDTLYYHFPSDLNWYYGHQGKW